jgi:hypothetical protein
MVISLEFPMVISSESLSVFDSSDYDSGTAISPEFAVLRWPLGI